MRPAPLTRRLSALLLLVMTSIAWSAAAQLTPPLGPPADVVPAAAKDPSPHRHVVVLADKRTRPFREAMTALSAAAVDVETVDAAAIAARLAKPLRDGEVFVALGPQAASLLAKTSHRGAAAIVRASEAPGGIPAVGVEVPPEAQLPWIRQAFPGRTRVLVLRKPGALDEAALIRAEPRFRFVFVDVESPTTAVFALERALQTDRGKSLVWLLPDPAVITANTIAPLSQAALSARVPVVGFSAYFLRVGALAAVEVDFGQMARAALDLAARAPARLQGESSTSLKVKEVHAPPGAHLRVNATLAARLGIVVREGRGVVFE